MKIKCYCRKISRSNLESQAAGGNFANLSETDEFLPQISQGLSENSQLLAQKPKVRGKMTSFWPKNEKL